MSTTRMRTAPRRAGFTLLEIMIVVVIIGILAAAVLPRLIGKSDTARVNLARADIVSLKTALELFKNDCGRYPTNAEGLKALVERPAGVDNWDVNGYLEQTSQPVDPWNHPYAYAQPGTHGPYDIVCYGADGQPGGEGVDADIVSWNLKGTK